MWRVIVEIRENCLQTGVSGQYRILLSPQTGLDRFLFLPTACAVAFILTPLRGCRGSVSHFPGQAEFVTRYNSEFLELRRDPWCGLLVGLWFLP
jgi:hypothetical protein